MKSFDFGIFILGFSVGVFAIWVWASIYIALIGVNEEVDFKASKFCISKEQSLVLYKGGTYYCDGGAIFVAKDLND